MTSVGVVCVTHDSEAELPSLLDSLALAAGAGIVIRCVVADSGSTDRSLAIARDRLGGDAFSLGANAGYATGINAGARRLSACDALCVVNPDVRLHPGSLARLCETLALPGTGIVAPRLVDTAGATRPSLRRDPRVTRVLGDALLGGRIAGRFPLLGEMETRASRYARPAVVDWATGAALLISRACLDRVGPWDERFFLYSEEVDFAIRARAAGFLIRYDPRAVVQHAEGDFSRSPELASLLSVNRVRCYRKHHAMPQTVAFQLALLLKELVRSRDPVARQTARALVHHRSHSEPARAHLPREVRG